MDLAEKIAATREICAVELQKAPLSGLVAKLGDYGYDDRGCIDLLRSVITGNSRKSKLLSILDRIGVDPQSGLDPVGGIQRTLLLKTAVQHSEQLKTTPVHPSVISLICDEFRFFAHPAPKELCLFDPENYTFEAIAKIALLERFPAGEFHWEVSGLPLSWVTKVPVLTLPKLLLFIATKTKALAPLLVPHIATRRRNPLLLLERQSDRSWYRIARSVALQPNIRGLVGASWLHSVDTFKVSPHLAFMNKPFLESGGLVTTMGKADETAGYLGKSALRRQLYESGEFKPTLGLVLWSRDQMIQWAESHPELADD